MKTIRHFPIRQPNLKQIMESPVYYEILDDTPYKISFLYL